MCPFRILVVFEAGISAKSDSPDLSTSQAPKKSHLKISDETCKYPPATWLNGLSPFQMGDTSSNGLLFLHCHISFPGCTWKDYLILFQEEQKQPCVVGTTQFKKKGTISVCKCLLSFNVMTGYSWISMGILKRIFLSLLHICQG